MTEQEWMISDDPAAMLRSRRREWEKGGTYYDGIPDAKLRVWVEACRESEGDGRVKWSWNLDLPTQLAGAVREWAGDGTSLQYVSVRAALLRCMVGNPFRPLYRDDGGYPKPLDTVLLQTKWLVPHVRGLAADIRERADWRLLPLLADALEEAGCPARVEMMGPEILADSKEVCPYCSRWPADSPHGENGWVKCERWKSEVPGDDYGRCDRCNSLWKVGYDTVRVISYPPHPLLAHLRDPGPHGRGCHALALILGEQ